ncbi:hypothetical protein ES705_18237 [subsurface metagenome]
MNEILPLKLFDYYRVSTEKQDFGIQKQSIKEFYELNPHKSIDSFEDYAMSGALGWERPAFTDMVSRLDEVDGILIYDWDRISREEEFAVSLIYTLRRKKKVVFESNSNKSLDFSKMSDRLTGIIKSMWSEEERLKINKKMKDGIKNYKQKHGRWGRKKVFGVTLSGSHLSENQFWNRYEQYRKAKISKSGISRILNMSRQTLYKRLKEKLQKYQEIESSLV